MAIAADQRGWPFPRRLLLDSKLSGSHRDIKNFPSAVPQKSLDGMTHRPPAAAPTSVPCLHKESRLGYGNQWLSSRSDVGAVIVWRS